MISLIFAALVLLGILTGTSQIVFLTLFPIRVVSEWLDNEFNFNLTAPWLAASCFLVIWLLLNKVLSEKRLPKFDTPVILWALFLGWSALSMGWNETWGFSGVALARLASLFLLFVGARSLFVGKLQVRLLKALVFSSILSVGACLYQWITGEEHSANRIAGGMVHPNNLALYSNLIILLSVAFYSELKRKIFFISALANAGSVVLALSLNGFIMAGIALTIFLRKRVRLFLPLVIMVALLLMTYSPLTKRVEALATTQSTLQYGYSSNSLAWRILNFEELIPLVWKSPIWGHGPGTAEEIHPSKAGISPHNDYLRMLLEVGFPGLILWCFLLLSVSLRIWRVAISSERPIAFAVFSIFVAWIIGSFFDNFITATAFQVNIWLAIGSVLGSAEYTRSV